LVDSSNLSRPTISSCIPPLDCASPTRRPERSLNAAHDIIFRQSVTEMADDAARRWSSGRCNSIFLFPGGLRAMGVGRRKMVSGFSRNNTNACRGSDFFTVLRTAALSRWLRFNG
jgi:hypothetical protein